MNYLLYLNTNVKPILCQERIEAIEAASKNGDLLGSYLELWCNDREVVEIAIRQNPFAIRHAPLFQNDREMALLAVSINGLARTWISSILRKDSDIQRIAEENLPTQLPPTDQSLSLWRTSKNTFFLSSRTWFDLIKKKRTIYDNVIYTGIAKPKHSIFLRDAHVTLFEGGHLIPYPIKDPLFVGYLAAESPRSADHFLLRKENDTIVIPEVGIVGNGFLAHNVDQAMITSMTFKVPFRRAMTCIEGGNCFLFMSKGERKALIGELSLYLSLIALEEQHYFEGKELPIELDKEPSLDIYRMARNLDLYLTKRRPLVEKNYNAYMLKKQLKCCKKKSNPSEDCDDISMKDNSAGMEIFGGEIGYRQLLTAPVSEEEKVKYYEEARRLNAKLRLTNACMAEELRVQPKDIVIVPQSMFHIDMEMFVTPSGLVILHDDQKAIDFLSEVEQSENLTDYEMRLIEAYKRRALEGIINFSSIREKCIEILNEHQIEFRVMPAIFRAPEFRSALNYCNGIFVQNKRPLKKMSSEDKKAKERSFTYISTGPSIKAEVVFHHRFSQLFRQSFPDFTFCGLEGMSKFIAERGGGIHCLTFETSLNSKD